MRFDVFPAKMCAAAGRGLRGVWSFYYDGFRSMTVGKKLWMLIFIKLFLFFVVMKLFFFPDVLKRDFDTDEQRASHVRRVLAADREPSASPPAENISRSTDADHSPKVSAERTINEQ